MSIHVCMYICVRKWFLVLGHQTGRDSCSACIVIRALTKSSQRCWQQYSFMIMQESRFYSALCVWAQVTDYRASELLSCHEDSETVCLYFVSIVSHCCHQKTVRLHFLFIVSRGGEPQTQKFRSSLQKLQSYQGCPLLSLKWVATQFCMLCLLPGLPKPPSPLLGLE